MHIEHLKLYCDIVRLKNFTRAAKKNNLTQARASQILNMLERTFGIQLIDRMQRPWVLSKEGKILFEESIELVSRYNDLVHQIGKTAEYSTINIGAIYSVAVRHMRLFIKRFLEHEPTIGIHLDYLHPDKIITNVREGALDLGVISFAKENPGLTVIPWQQELMVLACPPEHPFSSKSEIRVADIRDERMIMFDKSLLIREKVDEFLKKHGIDNPIIELEFDNIESMKKAVEAGSGISIIPRPTFEREIRKGALCAVHFINENFCRPLSLVLRKRREKSDKLNKFIQFLQYGNSV